MSTSKHFDKIVAVVLVLGLLLTAAFINGEALGIETIVDEDAEQYESTEYFTANDLNGDWDASNPTATIALSGDSVQVSGNGAYYYDGSVVITGAGTYVFSGTLDDGKIVVDAYDSSKVFILLDGAVLYCSDDACLRVENAEKVFLTLAAGTENRMESGEAYSGTALDDNTGGVIFAHDDLTVNGSGSLEIVANYKHGIDANDDLKITGGTITITCPADGLHVNDSFRLCNASLTIAAGDDAIHSDTDVYLESGTLLITECYEGVEAPIIEVAGGDIMIYPTDDGFNANGGSSGFGDLGGGMGGGMRGGFDRGESTDSEDSESTGEAPDFESGEMPDFGEVFEDGEMPTPPDWSESEDGERPEPPEQSEDGEQASEERPESGEMPDGEAPDMSESSDAGAADSVDSYIRITGGNIMIINENAQDADGLDSNGSVYIEGGTILVSLNGNGSNNAIDYGSENGGVAEISGGTIIAAGGASMAESFDATSTQPSIAYTTSAAAGTTVALRNASGTVLLTWDVPCSFTYLVLSSPDMTVGETYTLSIGDAAEEVTLESVVTTLGSSSGMGGMMGFDRGSFGGDSSDERGFPGGRGGHDRGGWGSQTENSTQNSDSAENAG
ncbi:MAG: carbohydrate-binding domain-containing protein [Oscillospiraceae bacterium]|nr:carbohydrate-binding domain-containing protein [Oscillospiraceae bacterium]